MNHATEFPPRGSGIAGRHELARPRDGDIRGSLARVGTGRRASCFLDTGKDDCLDATMIATP
jgi:hypothetical protein